MKLKLIAIFISFSILGCQKKIDPPEMISENSKYIIEHHYNEQKKTYTSTNIPILEIDDQRIKANGQLIIGQVEKIGLFYEN